MPTEKHPVPQHIMGVEFKLVGDLNVRQFFFLIGGGVLAFLTLRSTLPFYWKWPLTIFFALSALIAAFVPLGGRRADQWIRSFFNAVFSPTQRVWKKSVGVPTFISDDFINSLRKEAYSVAPQNERWRLKRFIEEFEEKEQKTKLDLEIDQFINNLNFNQPLPKGVAPEISKKIQIPKHKTAEKEPAPKEEKEEREPPKLKEQKPTSKKKRIAVEESATLAAEVNWSSENVITIPVAGAKRKKYITTLSNVKPGRRLKSLPRIQGEIVMPVKGKKVVRPEGEEPEDEGFKVKEDVTKKFTPQALPGKESAQQPEMDQEEIKDNLPYYTPEAKEQRESEEVTSEKIVSTEKPEQSLQEKINELTKKIGILGKRLKQAQSGEKDSDMLNLYQEQINQLEKEKDTLFEKIGQKIPKKQPKKDKKEKEDKELAKSLSIKKKEKPPKKSADAEKEKKPGRHHIIGAGPNIIYGVVKDKQGSAVADAVIIVEDEDGNPVRALKTDRLGHFAIATKLPKGKYKVKASKSKLNFGIIETQLKGETPPPLEIIAKE